MNTKFRSFLQWFVLLLCLAYGMSACQPKKEMIVVGVVNASPGLIAALDGFIAGMTALGYIENVDITYLYDVPGSTPDELRHIADQFVEDKVDLILSISTPATIAARDATAESGGIPVVFVPVTNPVEAGLVKSLSEPGGNVTGVTNLSS